MVYNVVGGGPVGLWISYNLGKSSVVYEEHSEIGKPEHCTGLVSKRLEEIIKIPKNLQLNKIKGALFFSENRKVEITRNKVEATVIDRTGFDKHLAELAESNGAKIVRGKRVNPFKFSKNNTVFIAEGANSETLRVLRQKLKTLPSIQYVIRSEPQNKDFVELHFLHKDFFVWVVPIDKRVVKVGTASQEEPEKILRNFLRKRFSNFSILERQGGHIVINGPLKKTVYDNLVLVGDCAGQVKATTGGGIVTGLICAEEAAKNAETIQNYEKAWRSRVGFELFVAKAIRDYLSCFSPKDYDNLLEFAEKNLDVLKKYGDMDFHSRAVFNTILKPSNWFFLLKSLKL